jgi:hypothetical protein
MNWYIDSWSPTEGVVFASNRASTNDPWDVDIVQTVMMAAPYFEPHDVSRAMAFGAAQRGFQEQFSVQGDLETGFPSLELLTLFVRRTYSGSGSGPEGNGGDRGNGGDGGGGNDGDGGERARERERQRIWERRWANRHRRDWQSLKESEDAPKIGSLLSEMQSLSFEMRVKRLLGLVWQGDVEYLEDARTILKESLYEIAGPEPSQGQSRLRSIAQLLIFDDEEFYPRHQFQEGGNSLSLALMVPLPNNYARIVGLPFKVRTMMDALAFIAANRNFLCECSVSKMLPLLLAIAANFCSKRTAANWHPYRKGHREFFIQECCDFILRWLPFDPLPEPLECTVSDWSNLNISAQRRV